MKRSRLAACTSWLTAAALFGQPVTALAQPAPSSGSYESHLHSLVAAEPVPSAIVQQETQAGSEPQLSRQQLIALVRRHIKYVFVLYQENRSFDSLFGTFPGAEGLYSHPTGQTPGYTQTLLPVGASLTAAAPAGATIQPFRIGPAQFAADTDDIDHSHPRIVAKMDVSGAQAKMDKFALTEEAKYASNGVVTQKSRGYGELAMAYADCNTVPLLWNYANRFVLFDHIFQSMTGPSTPGNLAIVAAQTGLTQWVKHPNQAYTDNGSAAPGVPVLNDDNPLWGSAVDPLPSHVAYNPSDYKSTTAANAQINQTYATLMLSLAGNTLPNKARFDADPAGDLDDVAQDIPAIGKDGQGNVPWRWYEEGYDREPTDPGMTAADPVDASGTHASYVTHHNGPQYFGYVANNPTMSANLRGLNDFFNDVSDGALPRKGGVFYVKGGYQNIFGFKPANPLPIAQANFLGDDDHPAYSDTQISDAYIATAINQIAASPYWDQSAIIVTWDDSEGDYDHVPPTIRHYGPDGSIIGDGPRVPFILISPYARVHSIDAAQGNHASVVKFVDMLFNLPPLATLPNEKQARKMGEKLFYQPNMGPDDAYTPGVTSLLSAFDPARLMGNGHPLPASYAMVANNLIATLPQTSGLGCKAIGITPTDQLLGITNHIPSDFTPLPGTAPSFKVPTNTTALAN